MIEDGYLLVWGITGYMIGLFLMSKIGKKLFVPQDEENEILTKQVKEKDLIINNCIKSMWDLRRCHDDLCLELNTKRDEINRLEGLLR